MRRKHIPQRTCVACGRVANKRELVRVVRTVDGQVKVDVTGKHAGRGAYLCYRRTCWENALTHGQIARALRLTPSVEDQAALEVYCQSIPEDAADNVPEA
jgi:predicted RNA-binding protein YlxR (DUF448 family)